MNGKTTVYIDPTVRGLICCLIDLEHEALSKGYDITAKLLAAAQLSLTEAAPAAVNDNGGLAVPVPHHVLSIMMDERHGTAGG